MPRIRRRDTLFSWSLVWVLRNSQLGLCSRGTAISRSCTPSCRSSTLTSSTRFAFPTSLSFTREQSPPRNAESKDLTNSSSCSLSCLLSPTMSTIFWVWRMALLHLRRKSFPQNWVETNLPSLLNRRLLKSNFSLSPKFNPYPYLCQNPVHIPMSSSPQPSPGPGPRPPPVPAASRVCWQAPSLSFRF